MEILRTINSKSRAQCDGGLSLHRQYLMLTPVHNEELFIGPFIESVVSQWPLPEKWIIVDDGSTDKTREIVAEYGRKHSFIELRHIDRSGLRLAGGERALESVLRNTDIRKYEFIGRFDADLILADNYMSSIFMQFDLNPRLGIAGGGLYIEKAGKFEIERVPTYHVRGALKMYRRECLLDIGTLEPSIGWDTIDEIWAWVHDWETRSFTNVRAIHRRPTGLGVDSRHIVYERGRGDYLTWTHPTVALIKCIKIALASNPLLAAQFARGFFSCYIRCEKRIDDARFRRAARQRYLKRILHRL
jgi:biofilm PGA synthesis N-glycosyltransferase PgaC